MVISKEVIGALPISTVVSSPKHSYKVLAVIGSGGFGITYKVIRQQDGCAFAMKEYYPNQMCERNAQDCTLSYLKTNSKSIKNGIEDFITEAKRLEKQKISHPNMVAIDEVFKANNTAYYVMEFIDGCNLRQLIKKNKEKPIAVDKALNIMRPILQAVALLHKHRLTHLDIKHENIIVTSHSDGTLRPILIDFGQAKHYDKQGNATSKLTNAGCSDGFAPPEQYMGLTKFTPQADVYALCATLLYLISAKQPVISGEITAKNITDTLPEGTPSYIENAIVNGMRRNKDDRTQSVELLADTLKLDIATVDSEITDDLNLTKLIKPKPYAKFFKFAGIILAIVVFTGCILWLVPKRANSTPETSEEIIQTEMPTNDNDTVVRNSVSMPQPTKASEKEQKTNQGDKQQAVQQIINNSSRQSDSNTNANANAHSNSNAQLVSSAKNIAEMRSLANQNIPESYAPLSKMEFDEGNYDAAAKYAQMAQNSGHATNASRKVLQELSNMGY
jgi:serine/threonine protein kinase